MNVRKFIDDFEMPKHGKDGLMPNVIKEGREENVYYYTEHSKTRYIIESPNRESLKAIHTDELKCLLPKFGKFEIERFFEKRFLTALLITGDMTEIFNTTVLCSDSYWSCKFDKELVKKIFMEKCFTIIYMDEDTICLRLNCNFK